ncbi:MAG TPA: hypothetical protein VF624_04825 [Tepidisphaeraceae bacterium]|jgi:hypothetical protein
MTPSVSDEAPGRNFAGADGAPRADLTAGGRVVFWRVVPEGLTVTCLVPAVVRPAVGTAFVTLGR